MTSQKPMCGLDPKQWSALLLHACNWWNEMHFAAVYSFHAGQQWEKGGGTLGKRVREGGKGGG